MLGLGAFLTLPAIIGFGVLSSDVIVLLFGAKWAASADIAKVLALMAVPFCVNFFVFSGVLPRSAGPAASPRARCCSSPPRSVLSIIAAPFGVEWVARPMSFGPI
ncbi:MAG: hypothetical protein WDN69_09365 [Aliidongia sp.]